MNFFKKVFNDKYFILADQVLTSFMNFGSILLLSSLLNENIFSKFVVLYSYSALANTVLATVFSAPILVFGIKKWSKEKFNYLGANTIYFTGFNLLFSAVSFLFLRIQVDNVLFINFLLMNFGMTLIDIFKRFIFSSKCLPLVTAPFSSLIMNLFFFVGIFLFRDKLDMNNILRIYWISYLSASFIFCLLIYNRTDFKNEFSFFRIFNNNFGKTVFYTHFKHAKWVLAGAVSFWVYTQGIYIFGEAVGVSDFTISKLRTIQNLFGIFSIILIAMDNYLTPSFSEKALESEDFISIMMNEFYRRYSKTIIYIYILAILIMYVAYYVIYQDKYGEGILYIFLIWLTQLFAVSTKPISIALKAKEVTYPLFYSHLFAAISMLIFGSVFFIFLGDLGLVLTLFFAFFIANLMNYIYYKRVLG